MSHDLGQTQRARAVRFSFENDSEIYATFQVLIESFCWIFLVKIAFIVGLRKSSKLRLCIRVAGSLNNHCPSIRTYCLEGIDNDLTSTERQYTFIKLHLDTFDHCCILSDQFLSMQCRISILLTYFTNRYFCIKIRIWCHYIYMESVTYISKSVVYVFQYNC